MAINSAAKVTEISQRWFGYKPWDNEISNKNIKTCCKPNHCRVRITWQQMQRTNNICTMLPKKHVLGPRNPWNAASEGLKNYFGGTCERMRLIT